MGEPGKVKVNPEKVPCRGCGKTTDLSYQLRIAARLGMRANLTYQCSECYKVEQAILAKTPKSKEQP
jgi:hypothetical protein